MGATDCIPALTRLASIESWIGLACVGVYTALALCTVGATVQPYTTVSFTFHVGALIMGPFLADSQLVLSDAMATAWTCWHTVHQIPAVWAALRECSFADGSAWLIAVYALVVYNTLVAVLAHSVLGCLHACRITAAAAAQHARFMRLLHAPEPRLSFARFAGAACGRAPAA